MVDSPMRDRMSYACESKGFDSRIFWKLDRQRTSLMPAESNISPRFAADTNRLSLFVSTSKTLFTRYVLGFGMPGRVCHSGNYEWHEDISLLPGWSFQRKVQAESRIKNHNLRPGGRRRRRIRFNRRDGPQRRHRPVRPKDVQIFALFSIIKREAFARLSEGESEEREERALFNH